MKCLEWGNIIANKGAKLRVQSSFCYSKAVDPFFSGVAVLGLEQFSFLMVRWVDMNLFWFLELYWFQKGAIEVDCFKRAA